MTTTTYAGRAVAAAIGLALMAHAAPASAQAASDCSNVQKLLGERQGIVQRLNNLGKKNVDPRKACSLLTELATNGTKTAKFVEANQAWCGIPDNVAQTIKADHGRVSELRSKACAVAQKVTQMEKQARQQAQQQQQGGGPGGLLGGPGLTGEYRIPRGAL